MDEGVDGWDGGWMVDRWGKWVEGGRGTDG